MARPRGPTGSVSGIAPDEARTILTQLVEGLAERAKARRYRRHQAADWLRQHYPALTPVQVTAFVQTLDRTSGFAKIDAKGGRLLPPEPAEFIRLRAWRQQLVLGDPAPAKELAALIEKHDTPPGLRGLAAEISDALDIHSTAA